MESTLERLLRIQGGAEQMSMEELEVPAPPAPGKQAREISQLFDKPGAILLGEMYKAGDIELLEPLTYYPSSGLMYAHFLLKLEPHPPKGPESCTAAGL